MCSFGAFGWTPCVEYTSRDPNSSDARTCSSPDSTPCGRVFAHGHRCRPLLSFTMHDMNAVHVDTCPRKTRYPRPAISLVNAATSSLSAVILRKSRPVTSAPSGSRGRMSIPCSASKDTDAGSSAGTPSPAHVPTAE